MFTTTQREEIKAVKAALLLDISTIMQDRMYPTELVKFIVNNCVLTGGAIASTFHHQRPNDYDLYIKDPAHIGSIGKYLEANPQWVKDLKEGYLVKDGQLEGKVWSNRAITLIGDIQLIIMGTVDIRSTFDFEHCKPWLNLQDRSFHISELQYHSIKNRQLIPANNPSQHRIFKYEDRGWEFPRAYLSPVPVDNIPVPPAPVWSTAV